MRSLPVSSKRTLQIGGIVAGVLLLGVLIAGGIASRRQPGRVDAVVVDSSTSTVSTSTTTAPAEEPEASVGPLAGEAREEATATTLAPEPNQGSAASAGGTDQPEQAATKKPSSSGSTSHQDSATTAGKCQPVGCNGGRGDHYTPDVDAPSGHHTVGSPGGTAKTVPNQAGQVVDLNQ